METPEVHRMHTGVNVMRKTQDPKKAGPRPPYSRAKQSPPGKDKHMKPAADHGEESYVGASRLVGKAAVITGADSGIGRAVAIAFAREGADIVLSFLQNERDDAQETARWIEQAGRRAILIPGDVGRKKYCESVVNRAIKELGRLDILINNRWISADLRRSSRYPGRRVRSDIPNECLRNLLSLTGGARLPAKGAASLSTPARSRLSIPVLSFWLMHQPRLRLSILQRHLPKQSQRKAFA